MVRWLRSPRRWLVACLLCFGFWQFGQGAHIPAKAWIAQELMQRAWLRGASGIAKPVPWPWADTWPVARLTARGGDVELIVLAGDSGRTLAFGPGHLSASALPGEPGNTVIAGHRDTHFSFLRDIEIGEFLVLETVSGKKHLYKVVGTDVVDSRRGSLLLDTDEAYLSLVTCYPFEAREPGGPMRYVVTAKMLF
ncbi:MAG: class GN sortase [Gammaproteobacteria bacterium]|nr:class GN sortase [Gammaproteobacteria bacterium]MDH5323457.1 class GN sortase [Gammaproteobacteria bacterium]